MKSPFVILIDTRETKPWKFEHVPAPGGKGEIDVQRKWQCLGDHLGDYTIQGAASLLSIERKSLNDLFQTILGRRDNFEIELYNLQQMEYAAVIVEAPLEQVISHIPEYFQEMEISPDKQLWKQRQVIGSIVAYQLRYPNVRWFFLSRSYAEIWAYKVLDRFYEDRLKGRPSYGKAKSC